MAVSPFAWRPCCLRTIQRPLAASPCGRLSRPRSTISQSDCRRAIGPFSPFRLGRPYKRPLEPDGSPFGSRVKNLAEKITAIRERRERHKDMLAELDRTGESQISLTDPDSRAMAAHTHV